MSCPYPHDPRVPPPTRPRNNRPVTNDIPYELLELLLAITCNTTNGWGSVLGKPIPKVVEDAVPEMKDYILLWQDHDVEFTGACLDRMIPILKRMHELLVEESAKRRAKSKLYGV